MIVFGGHQAFPGTNLNDVWVLTNADETGGIPTWVPLFPIGPPPTARQDFGTAYDVPNNRLIVFGGLENVASTTFSDVWILTNANGLGGTPQWIQLTPIGGPPLGRAAPVFQYDPVANRVILFGGSKVQGSPPIFLDEVWVLSGANGLAGTPQWTQLTPSGTPPAGRCCAASGYSTASNRLVLALGRNDEVAPFLFNDAWVLAFNEPPDCSGVTASPGTLWPPNHRLRLVTLSGATDPDGDPVTLTITGVTQNEPVSGLGGGDLSPDAQAGTQSNNVKVPRPSASRMT